MIRNRVMTNGWMFAAVAAIAGAVGLSSLSAFAQAPPAADGYACDGKSACRDAKTRLPLRILPRAQRNLYSEMNDTSAPLEANVTAFVPMYVFERHNVSYADPIRPQGWFRVGKTQDKPDGFMKAADALEWKTAIVVSYAHRGIEGNQRKPVIMFKDKRPLEDLMQDAKFSERANDYYKRLERSDVPDEIITREPDTFVDIKKKFYLLPVLSHVDLFDTMGIEDARILQIAAAVPGRAAVKAEDVCTTEKKAKFAECAAKTGLVTDDELKIDVVYVIDFTGSMQEHINATLEAMRASATTFQGAAKSKSEERVRFGLIGFRDHPEAVGGPGENNEYVFKNFTPELVSRGRLVELLQQHGKAQAGGDIEEEVFPAVLEGINAKWSDNSVRLLFLIGDASSHDPSHRFSTTQKDARTVRLFANEQNVYVASIYIKNTRQASDWAKGQEQFRIMAENPGGTPSFRAVDENPQEISNALLEVTSEMIDRVRKLHADKVRTTAPATAAASTGGPVMPKTGGEALTSAFNAGLVEFIGRATEPPPDITAWVVDKDITNLNRRAFDVHVLLTRADLDQLTKSLQSLIEAYEIAKLTGDKYFKSLQSVVTTAALDVNISLAETLANSPLFPSWIAAMPYKSEITTLKFSDFEEMTADKRQQLQQKLRGLVTLYRQILERQESWIRLNDTMKHEDYVYPLPLDNLP